MTSVETKSSVKKKNALCRNVSNLATEVCLAFVEVYNFGGHGVTGAESGPEEDRSLEVRSQGLQSELVHEQSQLVAL